jgi:hypothetical protein
MHPTAAATFLAGSSGRVRFNANSETVNPACFSRTWSDSIFDADFVILD